MVGGGGGGGGRNSLVAQEHQEVYAAPIIISSLKERTIQDYRTEVELRAISFMAKNILSTTQAINDTRLFRCILYSRNPLPYHP